MNKKISLVLTFLIFMQYFSGVTFQSFASTNSPSLYDNPRFFEAEEIGGRTWENYKDLYGIPFEVKRVNKNGYAFSMEHWEDKQIVVYGDYEDVPRNDFKNETRVNGTTVPNKGYYRNNSGEYRYHGFDAEGNPYSNSNFPPDKSSNRQPTEKNWIYRPWDKDEPYATGSNSDPLIGEISDYNETAISNRNGSNEVREWIKNGMPFQIESSTNSDKSAYNYAHVKTRPTSLYPGEVMMWHVSNAGTSRESFWHQSFTLSKIEEKASTPVQAEIHITDIKEEVFEGSGGVKLRGVIRGKLMDDYLYDGVNEGVPDEVLRSAYYNREDIKTWSFDIKDQITGNTKTINGGRGTLNIGEAEFEITIPYSKYKNMISKDNQNLEIVLDGTATVNYHTGDKGIGYATTQEGVDPSAPIEEGKIPDKEIVIEMPIIEPPEIEEPTPTFNFDISAIKVMLDTERFEITDNSVMYEEMMIEVYVGSEKLSESEAENFLNGNHLFPLIGRDKIYNYRILYTNMEGKVHEYFSYVLVHTTKPTAQFFITGTLKENRLLEATRDISLNSDYLMSNSTFTTEYFTVNNNSGSNTLIKYGTNNDTKKSFIVKDQAELSLKMKVRATINPSKIERSDIPSGYHFSDEYENRILVLEDHKPALIANIWNGVLTRNEALNFTYEAESIDGDSIAIDTYKIYYDTTGNGIPNSLIKQGDFEDYTEFKPSNLGNYKIVFYAKEEFGEPTLSQFVTDADKKSFTIEREFFVENIAPMTKIYTDLEYNFPKVDVMVLKDESLTREKNNAIASERVNWINSMRQLGVDAWIENWDLYTYEYSETVSRSRNTGSSSPPSTIHYSSGGYSGTLSRYDYENNEYKVDNSYWKTVEDSRTETDSRSDSGTSPPLKDNTLPSSISYSSGGYSGTLSQDSYSYDWWPVVEDGVESDWKFHWSRYATYSGTVTKSEQVYVKDVTWYDNYTGYYSGTVYKYEKASYIPNLRNGSDKYVVYFTNSNITNKTDLQYVLNKADSSLILVSTSGARSQFPHDYWIDASKPLNDVMKEVNKIISENNPVDNRKLLLVNQTFETNVANFDMEGDPLTEIGFQYIHEPTYFDNSMGQELGTNLVYTQTDFTPDMKDKFSKSGKYTIYRLIEDRPSGKPDFNKVSNTPALDVYVHRKPIAEFALDWDYNPDVQTYKTTWVDLSYDKDHQHTDPERGIRDRQIMYRKTDGDNQWIYAIPDNLAPGNYEIRYIVKDIEGVWSDPFVEKMVLEDVPELELKGKLTPKTLPASEKVTLYDIETKYHLPHGLKIDLMGAGGVWIKEVCDYGETDYSHRSVDGSKHNWNAIVATLSEDLSDGAYYMRLISGRVALDLPFTIQTPISVQGQVSELIAGETGVVRAVAGQYAKTVYAKVFEGTPYEHHVQLAQIGTQPSGESIWEADFEVGDGVVEDQYRFNFYAQTASGNEASHLVMKQVIVLKILSFDVTGYWNHWRGQGDLDGKTLTLNPHRFLGLEKVRFTAFVQGNPDEIQLDVSTGLKAMTYRDGFGNLYKYTDEFEADIAFPVFLVENEPGVWLYEYNLPVTASTLSWDDVRIGPSYTAEIKVTKGAIERHKKIEDIDLTGTIFDLIYTQPYYGTH